MKIEQLKASIENNTLDDQLIIFLNSEHSFIADQYIHEIANLKHKPIEYIEDLSMFGATDSLFEELVEDTTIKVLRVEQFESISMGLNSAENLIIVCNSISDDIKERFAYSIVEVPKLLEWQIKDFIYTNLPGVDKTLCDWLYNITKGDIFRIQQEVDKLKLFSESEQKFNIEDFIRDDIFSDLCTYTIFNLTDAILVKDLDKVGNILKDVEKIDVEPMGLLTTLYNNFKNVINVQLTNNPTADSLGMKQGQFNAIRHKCGYYNKVSLSRILEFLTDIDRQIKIGNMPMEYLRDYLIIKVLSL